jgi:ABC-2 type transport system permease protein
MSLFLRQFRLELVKLFARKRTWVGFGVFVALEVLIFLIFNTRVVMRNMQETISRQGLISADYMGGLTIGFTVFLLTSVLLGAIFLALVAGDIVAKEVEDGTMRMTLCRPVSRLRVLSIKYAACVVHHFTFIFFIGLSILGVGCLWRGPGGFFLYIPEEHLLAIYPPGEGFWRYVSSMPFFGLTFMIVTSLGFFFSCCNMKPVVCTVLAVVILLIDRILYELPYFRDLRGWFLHSRLTTWTNVLQEHVDWSRMATDYLWLFAFNATLFVLAVTIFSRRDFKS